MPIKKILISLFREFGLAFISSVGTFFNRDFTLLYMFIHFLVFNYTELLQ